MVKDKWSANKKEFKNPHCFILFRKEMWNPVISPLLNISWYILFSIHLIFSKAFRLFLVFLVESVIFPTSVAEVTTVQMVLKNVWWHFVLYRTIYSQKSSLYGYCSLWGNKGHKFWTDYLRGEKESIHNCLMSLRLWITGKFLLKHNEVILCNSITE